MHIPYLGTKILSKFEDGGPKSFNITSTRREKLAKQAWMNGESIRNSSFKKVLKRFSMQVLGDFSKSATTFLTSSTFPLLYSYLDLFKS